MATERIGTRGRISGLWAFVMFNMIFADIFSFMTPGALQKIMSGNADGITITPEFLLIAAIVTEIPIAMVLLSLVLPLRAARRANVVAAVLTIAYVVGMGSATPHYIFVAGVETIGCIAIARLAWAWRGSDQQMPARGLEAEALRREALA
jgi:hypothetical protein